jgi:hypothetical protein
MGWCGDAGHVAPDGLLWDSGQGMVVQPPGALPGREEVGKKRSWGNVVQDNPFVSFT